MSLPALPDNVDAALAVAGTDLRAIRVLEELAKDAQGFAKSDQDKKHAIAAKWKIARHGGKVLIQSATSGARAARGKPDSEAGLPTLVELGMGATPDAAWQRSSRWQRVARMGEDEFQAVLTGIMSEDADAEFMVSELGGTKASTSNEWYTPARYIEAAREVMGGIDLDPATSVLANDTVGAAHILTAEDDGLSREWWGRVWLNPPYGKNSGLFTTKLVEEFTAGRVEQAVLLLNAYGFDSDWFTPLWAHPICFTDHRVEFTSPQRKSGGPANGNIFVYLGDREADFATVFGEFGHVVRVWPWPM